MLRPNCLWRDDVAKVSPARSNRLRFPDPPGVTTRKLSTLAGYVRTQPAGLLSRKLCFAQGTISNVRLPSVGLAR
jgi:hypothetical protein